MRLLLGALVGSLALGSVACEKKARTRVTETTASVLAESETAAPMAPPVNVYRFVNAEQTMTDARKAVTEERWPDALGAVNELLKKQPDNAEAQKMKEQATLEGPAFIRFGEFNKAVAQTDVAKMVRSYAAIPETSMYRARAQADYDRIKAGYVDNQETEARQLVRSGRCDDARHIARVTIELFTDSRARLEDAASGCRPSRNDPSPSEIAAAERQRREKAAAEDKKEAIGMAPITPVAPPPPPVQDKPADQKPVEMAKVVPAPAGQTGKVAPPDGPKPDGPKPTVPPKNVSLFELEALRTAGLPKPNLPPAALLLARKDNVKMIMLVMQVCLSDKGVPTAVNLRKSSDYSEANDSILSEVRKWRFKPYMSAGEAVPVCTAVGLQYKIDYGSKCGPRGSGVGNGCQD